jgi:peptidyl-prolyl cis-trans isomerase SurA
MIRPRMIPLALLAAVALSLGAADVVEEIVAVVNDDIITFTEYKTQYEGTISGLRQQFQGEELTKQIERYKTGFLDMMITNLLLLQEAKAKNLNVNEQVRMSIDNIKSQNNFQSDDDLRRALQQQGLTFEAWRKQLEEQLLTQGVIFTEVDRSIVMDDSEVIQYFRAHPAEFTLPREYKLRAIYLAPATRSAADLESRKKEILDKLAAETFEAAAKALSDPPLNETGGDLGKFKKGELEKTLEDAVDKLVVGQTTPWIETKNGFYLLKVEERQESRLQAFDEVKKDVEERLFNEKKQKKLDAYMKTLREKSYIKILKPVPISD